MKLYKLQNEMGVYWVIAEHPTEAEQKVIGMLTSVYYGLNSKMKTINILVMAESMVVDGKEEGTLIL